MQAVIAELRKLIDVYADQINAIPDPVFIEKSVLGKWSKQEVLGHLVDSAQNNLRRFMCGQYEPTPPKIRYNQDFWVEANAYQQYSKQQVLTLWRLVNEQILHVLNNMPVAHYQRTCDTGVAAPELKTLEFLAIDYLRHMKHHLNQILPGSFDIVYIS